MKHVAFALAAALLGLVACNAILGIEGATLRDSATDAGTDAPAGKVDGSECVFDTNNFDDGCVFAP